MQYNIHPIVQCPLYKAPGGKFVLELNVKKYLLLPNDKNYMSTALFNLVVRKFQAKSEADLLHFVYKVPQILVERGVQITKMDQILFLFVDIL